MNRPSADRPNLVHESRAAIERRIEKYRTDPDLDWDDAQKWEKHAMNAVLDLQKAEAERDRALRERDEFKEAAYRLENTIRLLRTEAK